ncbi:MAG: hypothetical protein JXD23_03530 [Spirochaetales bacterium]|nr:hypothetical protein [Spirochaetales bacterium]
MFLRRDNLENRIARPCRIHRFTKGPQALSNGHYPRFSFSFPPILKEETLRKTRETFQNLRESYEQTLTKARLLQNDYRAMERRLEKDLARFRSLVYGFYGKKNQTVRDFGMRPFKDGKAKAKKPGTTKA